METNIKFLVRISSKSSKTSEISYMIEGKKGLKIWGRRISEKRMKLSTFINLIHSDSSSLLT